MEKLTKHSIQWFYNLLANGECEIVDFKEQLTDKVIFGKSQRNFSPNYEEMARDVVAFANKKGGFIFLGIVDGSKELNPDFKAEDKKTFELIKQVQDRTRPTITLKSHKLKIEKQEVLVLEVPFSTHMHCTSRAEYLIRSNDGNRTIEPHEMVTIQAEKGLIVYDQKFWDLPIRPLGLDKQGVPIPGWQDIELNRQLYNRIRQEQPKSPYLKDSSSEFGETLGLTKDVNGRILPTTTGILFTGNARALREFPYNQIKYIRYYEDGSYAPFEFKGDLIQIADECYAQLKSETQIKEFHFGLFREYVEDYPQVVLREMLINAIAHRDYSRQQIIEIRKYPTYIEFESPGVFPQGITETNYLRKTNPRNPNIMDVFRELKYAEKAGSGFDKIFTALLSKGKHLPQPIQTEHSMIFKIDAKIYSEKLAELSMLYRQLHNGVRMDLEKLLVLNSIYTGQKLTFTQLEKMPFVNTHQLRRILTELQEIEFIETTGKTSGVKYLIHKSKLETTEDIITYSKQKKQDKGRQIEAILRYLDTAEEIDNEGARKLLILSDTDIYYVSRLFSEMKDRNFIKERRRDNRKTWYERVIV